MNFSAPLLYIVLPEVEREMKLEGRVEPQVLLQAEYELCCPSKIAACVGK